MADNALALKPPAEVAPKKRDRLSEIRAGLEAVLVDDLENVKLAKYIFEDDETLDKAGLTSAQRKKVRAWEVPRKEVAAALAMSASRLEALAKEDQKAPVMSIQRAVIQVPAPDVQRRLAEAVIIDVEPGK